jgi:hypothetical protein
MSEKGALVKRGRGRPQGSKNREKRTPASEAIARSRALLEHDRNIPEWIGVMTPRDVMMHAMAKTAAQKDWITAAKIAAMVAPYVHPRLGQIDIKVTDDLAGKSEAEIEHEIHELERQVAVMDVGPDGVVRSNPGAAHFDEADPVEAPPAPRTNPEPLIIDADGNPLN